MHRVYIFVDDERNLPPATADSNIDFVVCRSYADAISTIQTCRDNQCEMWLDLDHDLGEEKTGYDICKYVVENQIPLLGYSLHTMNPVGKQNMDQLLSHYGYARF